MGLQCCHCSDKAYEYLTKCKSRLYARTQDGDINQVEQFSSMNENPQERIARRMSNFANEYLPEPRELQQNNQQQNHQRHQNNNNNNNRNHNKNRNYRGNNNNQRRNNFKKNRY